MNKHKRIRIVIDLNVTEPTTAQDILPFVSRSLAAYPPGNATYSAIPLDPPVRPDQEGFSNPLFGSSHLSRGQS